MASFTLFEESPQCSELLPVQLLQIYEPMQK